MQNLFKVNVLMSWKKL